ncbi:hypothetical protein [Paenibacillus spongiae]|uniref:Ferric siderophore reductase C-terminal domain-containing protein n=1 Tax=Paenibacillus spongiae TaxID=2909671 RepID=A0ABY5SAV5_9BACL|nr:hypothetical protein [Paenibacillus spongiae]UVI30794.1 hypothetical protein L1F29_02640 [Paenibacillus spongiae]
MDHSMDLSLLESFCSMSASGAANPAYSIPAADLLLPERMEQTLIRSNELLKATSPELPASFMGLSIYNLGAAVQLVLAQHNRLLDLSLSNLTFQIVPYGNYALAHSHIHEIRWTDVPDLNEQREAFLKRELTALYKTVIGPLIRTAAQCAGVMPSLMWNQFGSRTLSMREYLLQRDTRPIVRERFDHDYKVLTELDGPDVFERRRNPYVHRPRYAASPYEPGKEVLIRSSCCMYYCRVDGEYCYTCPKLTAEQRNAKFDELQKKAT